MSKYKIDNTYFEKIDTEEKAYIYGFLYADGYINYKTQTFKIDLKQDDEEILEKIAKCMSYTNTIKHYRQNVKLKGKQYDSHIARLVVTNKKMCDDLYSLGLRQKKSNIATFPKSVPKNLIRHFLRGYYDGNGSFNINTKRNNALNISVTSSDMMINDIKRILENQFKGVKIYKYHRNADKPYCSTAIIANKQYAIAFIEWLYCNATIWIDRKYKKCSQILTACKNSNDYPFMGVQNR